MESTQGRSVLCVAVPEARQFPRLASLPRSSLRGRPVTCVLFSALTPSMGRKQLDVRSASSPLPWRIAPAYVGNNLIQSFLSLDLNLQAPAPVSPVMMIFPHLFPPPPLPPYVDRSMRGDFGDLHWPVPSLLTAGTVGDGLNHEPPIHPIPMSLASLTRLTKGILPDG